MNKYEIYGWPDVQELMEVEGFRENSTLIVPNENIGIGSSTYLVSVEWLKSIDLEDYECN